MFSLAASIVIAGWYFIQARQEAELQDMRRNVEETMRQLQVSNVIITRIVENLTS